LHGIILEGFGDGHQQTDRRQRAQGAVRKRTKATGESTWTKRDKTTGKFSDQKKGAGEEEVQGGPPREERRLTGSASDRSGLRR